MAAAGFAQPSGPPRRFPIWVVLYVDKLAERPQRRIAGAFTSAAEANKLCDELRDLGGAEHYEYTVEPTLLHKRSEEWRADPEDPPYNTVPGLIQAKAILPDFKGHRFQTMSRIVRQRTGEDPETRGLEISWATGAQVQLGIEKAGTLLITIHPWTPPPEDSVSVGPAHSQGGFERWTRQSIEGDDPLAVPPGTLVRSFSVTENDDGSIRAIRVGFGTGALVVSVEGDRFVVDVADRR